jgi:hypothetical protein
VANSTRTTLLCGAISVALGSFYLLQSLGFVRVAAVVSGDERAVGACAAMAFVAGGAAVMLTTLPGPRARAAINLLALVIVTCFAAVTGWISIGPGPRAFGGSLVIFGPRVNEIGGRIGFGLSALFCLTFAAGIVRTLGRRAPAA